MSHLYRGEYSVVQWLTAAGFLIIAFGYSHLKLYSKWQSLLILGIGSFLFVDELGMLHECVNEVVHFHNILLYFEFVISAIVAIPVLKVLRKDKLAAYTFMGSVGTAVLALTLDSSVFVEKLEWLEETAEICSVCIAVFLLSRLRQNLKSEVNWISGLLLIFSVAVLTYFGIWSRTFYCPTVNHWQKYYFSSEVMGGGIEK